jgi:hypothetical protein
MVSNPPCPFLKGNSQLEESSLAHTQDQINSELTKARALMSVVGSFDAVKSLYLMRDGLDRFVFAKVMCNSVNISSEVSQTGVADIFEKQDKTKDSLDVNRT